MQLKIEKTVKKLFEDQEFWESEHFRNSLESGDFLSIDFSYFASYLLDIWREGDSTSDGRLLWETVVDYLKEADFKELVQKLFLLMSDLEILYFMYHLCEDEQGGEELNTIVSHCKWASFEDLLLYNALVASCASVVRLILCDEGKNIRKELDEWIEKTHPKSQEESQRDVLSHWIYKKQVRDEKNYLAQAEFMLLEGFLLQYLLKSRFCYEDAIEEIMGREGLVVDPIREEITSKKKKTFE